MDKKAVVEPMAFINSKQFMHKLPSKGMLQL
jgi:hypothetical protein